MRYLGIDYGAKRVGISISDESGKIAFPHSIVRNDKGLLARIAELVAEKKIDSVVLGDTRTTGGMENPITYEAENFGKELEKRLKIPTERIFEAWSSMEVSQNGASGNEHDDSAAAAFILQRYLDMHVGTLN